MRRSRKHSESLLPAITGAEVMADSVGIMREYLTPLIEEDPDSFEVIAHHLYGSPNTPQSYSEVGEEYSDDYNHVADRVVLQRVT